MISIDVPQDRSKEKPFPDTFLLRSEVLFYGLVPLTRKEFEHAHGYSDTTRDLQLMDFLNNHALMSALGADRMRILTHSIHLLVILLVIVFKTVPSCSSSSVCLENY